jgi:hypothetical protein
MTAVKNIYLVGNCGVNYTHANRSVVRTSKAESHMTKRAIEDVFELRQFSQQPANCFAAFEVNYLCHCKSARHISVKQNKTSIE